MLVSQQVPEWNSMFDYFNKVYYTFQQLQIEVPADYGVYQAVGN